MKGESGNKLRKQFGDNVQRLRESLGFTREELAEKTETSPQNIARIENGQRFVSSEVLEKIAASLQADVSDLFLDQKKITKGFTGSWVKIENLLKARKETDLEFAHKLLVMIFKKIPKI